jgi:sulfide:quinone oxidoreductase
MNQQFMEHVILVLGGGIGGLQTARELSSRLGNEDDAVLAKILVFEKEQKSTFSPSLTWLMVGKRKEWQLQGDLNTTSGAGIEFIFGSVEKVDPENLTVTSAGKTYKGTHMVVSLGVQQVVECGLDSIGHNFYTIAGANAFYSELEKFNGGHIAITVSSLPYKSPVAPYEAAMLIDSYIREKGLREKTRISIITPEGEPMRFAGAEVTARIMELMQQRGIEFVSGHQLTGASGKNMHFDTADGSKTIEADLLAFTPRHESPSVIREAGMTGETGWVEVDRETLQTKFSNVYAIGDITTIPISATENLPKAGVFAQFQAQTVAHNIALKIAGKSGDKVFSAEGKYVLDLGDGKASEVGGNFYSGEIGIKDSGMMNHWMKVLKEKSWFMKNF